MIETITVTTTPTKLIALIGAARGGITIKQPTTKSIIVRSLDDVKVMVREPSTVSPVPLLDPVNDQKFATLDTGPWEIFLSCESGTASVGVITT